MAVNVLRGLTLLVNINSLDAFTPSVGNGKIAKSAPAERRRRARVRVHWPIVLFPNQAGADPVETITQNLSSRGFYCLSGQPFIPGELLRCRLRIPMHGPGAGESHLECRVRVVRVEENAAEDQFGIACQTEDYRFVAARG